MTGIERLRELAEKHMIIERYLTASTIDDIADQIERERACDSDTAENIRLIVGGVIDDMERHVSGVEGADDSPVARWARELREALGGEGHDHAEAHRRRADRTDRLVLGEQRQVALRRRAEERANQGGSMQELKSCPCCGSSNGLYVLQEDEYGEWSVFCDMCKTSFHNENHCDTREDAISAWNRRAERTCRNLNPPSCRDFECSECGESSEFTPGFMPNYCPHCGARVIEEGV